MGLCNLSVFVRECRALNFKFNLLCFIGRTLSIKNKFKGFDKVQKCI